MIIQEQPTLHLAYCQNIHPGETWDEHLAAIREKAVAVRDRTKVSRPFGLGLRMGNTALQQLLRPGRQAELKDALAEDNLYAFTINGFPYGKFHGASVKEKVYQPDWRTSSRRDYTQQLSDVLAGLLPEGTAGSISTVPGSFKPWILRPNDADRMVEKLMDCVDHLIRIEKRTGREIHLGLEPEPGCYLETTEDVVRFYKDHVLRSGARYLQRRSTCSAEEAESRIRRHLGICFDTCHIAIQFEDLRQSIDQLRAEGIRISKIQLSAALEVFNERSSVEALHPFVEPVYLHQVKARTTRGSLRAWNDLPDALHQIKDRREFDRFRVHFHVPLFWEGSSRLGSTVSCLDDAFLDAVKAGACEHLEIETYTFDVLPAALRCDDVVESISQEYEWVMQWAGLAPTG